MPQIRSAQKALRQDARRRAANDRWRKLTRETTKAAQETAGDAAATVAAVAKAQSVLDRAARRRIIPANRAGRLKARLSRLVRKPA